MNKILIGDRIREVRKSKRLTQEQLAEKADISVTYLSEIERNIKRPGLNVFSKIVIALDTSADYILRGILPSGKQYVYDEITNQLEKLSPGDRKIITDIINVYVKNKIF